MSMATAHYNRFWNYEPIAEDLIDWGSLVSVENKYAQAPFSKANEDMARSFSLRTNVDSDLRQGPWTLHFPGNNEFCLQNKIPTSTTGKT